MSDNTTRLVLRLLLLYHLNIKLVNYIIIGYNTISSKRAVWVYYTLFALYVDERSRDKCAPDQQFS